MMWTNWISIASAFGGLAVALGAFGSHALKGHLGDYELGVFETAVRYQMYHALALGAVALLASYTDHWAVRLAGVSFSLGIVLFSGSLYALAFTGLRLLGAITPLGGLAFLVGWIALIIAGLR